ncbi:MAG: AHH domain-containing protein, partial [Phycisphaerales bacterium]
NRYYDPATGQFTQQDPIGIAGGLNLYGFANGDPVNFSDPFGLCGIAGAVGSVVLGAAIGVATGGGYSVGAALVDAGTGAGCVGVLSKAGKVGKIVGSSRLLRRGLLAAGEVAEHGDEAHHIVASGARGAAGARGILADFGININDAANGAFLPASFHRRMHTASYYQEVTERLSAAGTREEAIDILKTLGDELRRQARR